MFIQTELTPNPATLKFLPGRAVIASGTANFTDAASAAARSPLAERLFAVGGVTGVFLGGDFVTVTKDEESDWDQLKPAILGIIMEHFTAGRPVLLAADGAPGGAGDHGEPDTGLVTQFQSLLVTVARSHLR